MNDEIDELVTAGTACAILAGSEKPISKPTLYRGVKAGRYPAPVHPSPGISRFKRSELLKARAIAIGEAHEAAEGAARAIHDKR